MQKVPRNRNQILVYMFIFLDFLMLLFKSVNLNGFKYKNHIYHCGYEFENSKHSLHKVFLVEFIKYISEILYVGL